MSSYKSRYGRIVLVAPVKKGKKKNELREQVRQEALELQDLSNQKVSALAELKEVNEKREKQMAIILSGQIGGLLKRKEMLESEVNSLVEKRNNVKADTLSLEEKVKNKFKQYEDLTAKEYSFLADIEQRVTEKEKTLKAFEEDIKTYSGEYAKVVKEFKKVEGFFTQAQKAQKDYLKVSKLLKEAEEKKKKALKEIAEKEAELNQKQKEFDHFKEYLTQFYGKVATYAKVAKETVKQVNENLKGKVPFKFEKPPEVITFKDFNKKDKANQV